MADPILDNLSCPWGIFNATDHYRRNDIKAGIWRAMYGIYGTNDTWRVALQDLAVMRKLGGSRWERKIVRFMLTAHSSPHSCPQADWAVSCRIARRIVQLLRAQKERRDRLAHEKVMRELKERRDALLATTV